MRKEKKSLRQISIVNGGGSVLTRHGIHCQGEPQPSWTSL
uniref:Uncharacterized protein n=1 Tax=Romanomermis culicivorax TaxID=13658 RepID=A0A915JXQ4_ROMCU